MSPEPSLFSPDNLDLEWLRDKRATVMGLGVFGGGRGVTEFLCAQGAEVTVTDLRPAEELAESLEPLRDLPVRYVLEEHREEDFLETDLVVVNPAVPRTAPLLRRTQKQGVRLETEMNLFLKLCPARLCGITGSNGKTTTTSLTHAIFEQGEARTWLGGNIGRSLLPHIEEISADDWVILELSSFHLEDLRPLERRPEVSVVVNLSPNHLDRHGTYENYIAAKKELLRPDRRPRMRRQRGIAVLNVDDKICERWADETDRDVVEVSTRDGVLERGGILVDHDSTEVRTRHAGSDVVLFRHDDLSLVGAFNVSNAALAAAAALGVGAKHESIRAAITAFRGVEHRLERIAEIEGVTFYNDSIATTPESTLAALEALGPDVVLICGGSSKGCSFDALGDGVVRQARAAVLVGQTADEIEAAILAASAESPPPILRAQSLEQALTAALGLARPGSSVVLSPACPSYDQFRNFRERGDLFRSCVEELDGVRTEAL